jgi:uncharacterized paraquat-inducible protein A
MAYVKAIVVGVVTGLFTAVLWVFAALILPVWIGSWLASLRGDGVWGGAAVVDSGSMALAALIGFALGFGWTLRRERRRQRLTKG